MRVIIEDGNDIKAEKPLRTPSGAPTAYARQKYSVFGDGTYPVWDKESAVAAIDLRGRLTAAQQKKLLRVCKKFAPDEAQAAMDEMMKEGGKSVDLDELVYFGGAVKAMGDGRVGGYLVRFGNPKETDLEREYFTKDTDFDIEDGQKATIYYHHGLDPQLKRRKLGRGTMRVEDAGVWIEGQLNMRDDYEKAVYGMVEAGKLGWSSGTASHLVERETVGKATWLKAWPLGADASLTPTPAEPRNAALPIKSLMSGNPEQAEADAKADEASADVVLKGYAGDTAQLQLRAKAYLMGD